MACAIPDSHRDLIGGRYCAALTTVMPDGQPQTTVVWFDYEGEYLRVSTVRGFRKEKNMRANPRVTLLAFDPRDPRRYIEVRGCVVEMTTTGALAYLDALGEWYTGHKPYYGAVVPAELQAHEVPVLCRILPTRVVTLAAERDVPPAKPLEIKPHLPGPGVIPASHVDLFERPLHAVFTTMLPDGQPHSTLVWCDYDGTCVRVNTSRERRQGANVVANPKVSLLVIDPENSSRWIEVRGRAEVTEEGALEHLDLLTRYYTNHPQYYGYVFPVEKRERETRILCRIRPDKITLDAIHK